MNDLADQKLTQATKRQKLAHMSTTARDGSPLGSRTRPIIITDNDDEDSYSLEWLYYRAPNHVFAPYTEATSRRIRLLAAIDNNQIDVVRSLIARRAQVNKESSGETPLMRAVGFGRGNNRGHVDIVRILIAAGADINKYKPDWCTHNIPRVPFGPSCALVLHEAGATVELDLSITEPSLHFAAMYGNVDDARALVLHFGVQIYARCSWPPYSPPRHRYAAMSARPSRQMLTACEVALTRRLGDDNRTVADSREVVRLLEDNCDAKLAMKEVCLCVPVVLLDIIATFVGWTYSNADWAEMGPEMSASDSDREMWKIQRIYRNVVFL